MVTQGIECPPVMLHDEIQSRPEALRVVARVLRCYKGIGVCPCTCVMRGPWEQQLRAPFAEHPCPCEGCDSLEGDTCSRR